MTALAAFGATIRPVLAYDPGAAVTHLRRADPTLARIIDAVDPFALQPRDGIYRMLARAIFFQQLAGPAARAILNRVLVLIGTDDERFFTPEQFLAASDEQLRAAGLSLQKLAYLRDLSHKFASGQLSDGEFANADDEERTRKPRNTTTEVLPSQRTNAGKKPSQNTTRPLSWTLSSLPPTTTGA